ncbi:MAG: glycosyltransferase [Flavobacteriales bacterium]|nr:glycosyltransferase [Flavobacteriales bacterium]
MRIGILLSRFPYPLEKGDKLRAFHQIRELSKTNQIFLCAISDQKVDQKSIDQLKPYCEEIKIIRLSKPIILWNLLFGLFFSKLPLQVAYFYKKSARKELVNFFVNHKVDHIFCQLIRVSEYLKDLKSIPKTIDYMDVLSKGMERRIEKASPLLKPLIRIETKRLKKYEHFIFTAFQHQTIISEQDRDLIIHGNNHEIEIIRNGVDQEFFSPRDVDKKYDLVFTGNMSYPPNVDGVSFLVEKILPVIWEDNPNIKLVIAGANPNSRVQKLAQEKVIVTGWVDDIREYYASARIFIAPMQIGTGLQNKLLEAMAMKIPCITSPLANNALKATHEENILIAEHISDYVVEIQRLLNDQSFANRIAQNGFDFVGDKYNWNSTTKQLENLFLKS